MEIIDRYLQAVSFWLPSSGKVDILAELSEDIHAQVEASEEELRRSLTEEEIGELLKHRGRPMLVANAYQPKRHLIGSLLFPIYTFVLKCAAACYLLPTLLVFLILALHATLRAPHDTNSVIDAVATSLIRVCSGAMVTFFWITVTFAVLERTNAMPTLLRTWKPRNLPPVRDLNKISRTSAIFEAVMLVAVIAWWAARMSSPLVFQQAGIGVTFAAAWPIFLWSFVVVWAGQAALSTANAMRSFENDTRRGSSGTYGDASARPEPSA